MTDLQQIIEDLTQEAALIQIQGRSLRPDEIARVQAIYEALPHLKLALEILETKEQSTLITYKIVTDLDGKLKQAARVACSFWNRFVLPSYSVVIRLGIFKSNSNTIARAYKPYERDGVHYGVVEFNTKYLKSFSRNEISGTIIHEIGHTLGIGWNDWEALFDKTSGKFTDSAIKAVGDLKNMRVETDYGQGTQYSHWDEQRHDEELMTGFKDAIENVLPVTIDVMALLGHQIAEKLSQQTDLNTLLDSLAQITFSQHAEAKALNLDHFEETEIWENVPHDQPIKKKK
ncbi:MAG: hypothetical protein JJV98_12785 [Desulfosarcina sp.]|nr:hypothetical protein [Desulfobacterales bacterium]